jgi:predicted metal-dependent enzyme (double-stranded beta helix superfamily)
MWKVSNKMFYKDKFVGNLIDLLFGDYKEATTLQELKSLIEKLVMHLESLHSYNAPEELTIATQERLVEVAKYFVSVGGELV